MISELSTNTDDCLDSGIAFLSLTKDCLTWDYKGRLYIVSSWLKYSHKLLSKIDKMASSSSSSSTPTVGAAHKMLRDLWSATIPNVSNPRVLIQALYVLIKHISKADISNSTFMNTISNKIKSAFLKAEVLEKLRKEADPTAAPATLEGYITPLERSAIDKELVIKGIKCLVTLASRDNVFAPPLANYIGEYAQFFAHDRAFQKKIEQLSRIAGSFAKGARNLGQQDPRLYINGCEMPSKPLFSKVDDSLWLAIKKAFTNTHLKDRLGGKCWSFPKKMNGQSDMVLVNMSHSLCPQSKEIVNNIHIQFQFNSNSKYSYSHP